MMHAAARLVVVRPQPGADRTAAAARAAGWVVDVMPLFAVMPLAWTPPDPAAFDALLLTSANTIRHGGNGLHALARLPVVAVGGATAAAATAAGFGVVHTGAGDGRDAAAAARRLGYRHLLHLGGRDLKMVADTEAIAVYASEVLPPPPSVVRRLGGVVLLHSSRAAARVAALAGDRSDTMIAAVSPAALAAAGAGWRAAVAAERPTDAALLDAAAQVRDRFPSRECD